MSRRFAASQLVGREDELQTLLQRRPRAGSGFSVVLLGGEAGVGKTRLIREFRDRVLAAEPDALFLHGGCLELGESVLPLAPLVGVLRELAHVLGPEDTARRFGPELVRFLPGEAGRPMDEGWGQALLFEEVRALMAGLAAERPAVLVVEDIHWADRSTLNLLVYLARFLEGLAVTVVASFRSDELRRAHPLRQVLAELSRLPAVLRLELAPLSHADTEALLTGLGGGNLAPDLREQLLMRAEGNPFFAEELVTVSDAGTLPPTLRDVFAARIDRLPEHARGVLGVAALVGRDVDAELLERVSPTGESELAVALRAVVEDQALVTDEHGYRFRHALLQQAVYAELLPGERVRLHRAVADVLEEHPRLAAGGADSVDAELAHHALAAQQPARALPALVRAAHRASALFAFSEAVRHLELAIDVRTGLPDAEGRVDVPELLREVVNTALAAGDGQTAVRYARRAMDLVDPVEQPAEAGELGALLSRSLWTQGDAGQAVTASLRAMEVTPRSATAARALVMEGHCRLMLLLGRFEEGVRAGREAVALGRELDDKALLARALDSLGTCLGVLEPDGDWQARLHESIEVADRAGDVQEVVRSYNNLSTTILNSLGDAAEAERVAAHGLARAEELGLATRGTDWLRLTRAQALYLLGRWTECEQVVTEVRTTEANGPLHLFRHSIGALLRLGQGRDDEARAHLAAARAMERVHDPEMLMPVIVGEATLLLREGRYDEARAAAEALPGDPEDPELFTPFCLLAQIDAEAGLAGEEAAFGRLDALVDRVAGLAAARSGPVAADNERELLEVRAERTRLGPRPEPAAWRAALDARRGRPDAEVETYLTMRLAEALLLAGEREEAARELLPAYEVAGELGARPLREEMERLAARARVPLGEQAVSAIPGTPLTAREQEVLALVAEGRTNREIGTSLYISPKTASVHVSNLMMKLGATNRTEAAALARERGLLP